MPAITCTKCETKVHFSGVEKENLKELQEDFICPDCREQIQKDKEFSAQFYANISKEDIIKAKENWQAEHVKVSNQFYNHRKNVDELKTWIREEINITQMASETQTDDLMKGMFQGQQWTLERLLKKIYILGL